MKAFDYFVMSFCFAFSSLTGFFDSESFYKWCYPDISEIHAANAFGKTVGVEHSYSSIGGWLAWTNEKTLWYGDGNWHHLCNGENGLNLGGGVRFGDSQKGVGANLYYDWRNQHSRNFHQMSAGIETWLDCWESRLNVYLPITSRASYDHFQESFPGGYEISSRQLLLTCQLASLLIGRRFDLSNCFFNHLSLLPAIGPYWISNSKQANQYGVMAEVDFRFYQALSFRAIATADPIFKTRFQAILTINFSLPLNCDCLEALKECFCSFYSRPNRQDLICIKKKNICKRNW